MKKTFRIVMGTLAVSGLMLAGCGSDDGRSNDTTGTETMHDEHSDEAGHTNGDGHDHSNSGNGHHHDHGAADHDHGDGTNVNTDGSGNGTGGTDGGATTTTKPRTFTLITYDTPKAERTGTTTALNGLRATLMAELEAVRGRLGAAGGNSDAKKADQTRAAELAQGLERMDRLIKKVGEADDVTWADLRDGTLKEAEEVRVWMQRYNMPNAI